MADESLYGVVLVVFSGRFSGRYYVDFPVVSVDILIHELAVSYNTHLNYTLSNKLKLTAEFLFYFWYWNP